MKIKRDTKIRDVLAYDEEKMISRLTLFSPAFERLRQPVLRRAMGGRVTVEQAAKVGRVPLNELLYVLNLAVGEDEAEVSAELFAGEWEDYQYPETDPPKRPVEIVGVPDDDQRVIFVDLLPDHERGNDPMLSIAVGLQRLRGRRRILLLRHPFDPVPLRELFARKGFASWAEERKPGEWFIYFYFPRAAQGVRANPPMRNPVYRKFMSAAA